MELWRSVEVRGFSSVYNCAALTKSNSSHVEYRPLEGFVLAVSSFNFTTLGGNLPTSPYHQLLTPFTFFSLQPLALALVGNVVVWKPSPAATYSNYLIHEILTVAGVPPGVIQFVPGPSPEVVAHAIAHRGFAALHFTRSTFVFKKLWMDIAANIDKYKSYPRIVGETGATISSHLGRALWSFKTYTRREKLPCDPQVCGNQEYGTAVLSWGF